MSTPFTLRFVLAQGQPTLVQVRDLWDGLCDVTREDDGVLVLSREGMRLARVDMLQADDPRGKAVIDALRRVAQAHGGGESLEAVEFVLDGASAVVVAQPSLGDEDQLDDVMEPLDALWDALFEDFGGVLQVDGEGLYGEEGLLVEVP